MGIGIRQAYAEQCPVEKVCSFDGSCRNEIACSITTSLNATADRVSTIMLVQFMGVFSVAELTASLILCFNSMFNSMFSDMFEGTAAGRGCGGGIAAEAIGWPSGRSRSCVSTCV